MVVVLSIFLKDDSDFKINVFRLRSTLVYSSNLAVFVKMAYKIYKFVKVQKMNIKEVDGVVTDTDF